MISETSETNVCIHLVDVFGFKLSIEQTKQEHENCRMSTNADEEINIEKNTKKILS